MLAGLMLAPAGIAVHPSDGEADTAAIGRFVESQMRLSRLPAVALAIVGPEQEVYAAAFSPDDTAITPD